MLGTLCRNVLSWFLIVMLVLAASLAVEDVRAEEPVVEPDGPVRVEVPPAC